MVDPGRIRVMGPLVPYVDGFWAELAAAGYTPWSVEAQLRLMAHVSRWLEGEGLALSGLTSEAVEEFLRVRRGAYVDRVTQQAVAPLLGYLRGLGVVPAPAVQVMPVERLIRDYCSYLVRERGLAAGTVGLYEEVARLFLSERSEPISADLNGLSSAQITAFVLRECSWRSVGSAKTVVCGLRSLLRYLHVEGWTPAALVWAVPSVAKSQKNSLPRSLPAGWVNRLLAVCDRETALGVRDYAILVMLARLGLRAQEVAGLRLEDVDWGTGELLVRGKGNRLERLPLPQDVGDAVVHYLRRGRPRGSCPQLFVRLIAPRVGLSGNGVTSLVYSACDRAGLPRVGPHRLRHTLACELLRHGAPLLEIGQVLRHKSLESTAIYAKVDRAALSELARPWLGARP